MNQKVRGLGQLRVEKRGELISWVAWKSKHSVEKRNKRDEIDDRR